MGKNKTRKKQDPSVSGGVALSTLGEKLKSSNPELVEHFEAIKGMELSVPRLVQVVEDLLPYPWEDPALFEEGVKLTAQGFYNEAIAVFKDVLRISPNAYPAYHLLGHVYMALGNRKEEIENYKDQIKKQNHQNILQIRNVINSYEDIGKIHLGGIFCRKVIRDGD